METRIVQKAILRRPDGNILLLRRSKTDVRRPLQWDFPGGLLDEDEQLEVSILREIQEEAGLEARDLTPVFSKTEVRRWQDQTGYHTDNVVFLFYSGKAANKKPVLSFEHDTFIWLTPQKALQEMQYPLHQEVIEYLIKNKIL